MKKTGKGFVVVLCMLLMLSLTACAIADESFESAMSIINGTQREVEKPTEKDPPPDPQQPSDPDPNDPPVEVPEVGITWPEDVPPVTKFVKEFDFDQTDGIFTAHYTMTVSQLQIWSAALTEAGYLGDPRVKDGLVVEIVEKETGSNDKDTGERLLDVIIRIYDAIRTWPEEFSEFPKFEGKGIVSLREIYNEADGSRVLHIVLQNEDKASVEQYKQKLLSAGFNDRGEGIIGKIANGKSYEFDIDPDRIWKGTTADLYWVIRPYEE